MSIFGSIMSKVFHHGSAQSGAQASSSAPQQTAAASPTASQATATTAAGGRDSCGQRGVLTTAVRPS